MRYAGAASFTSASTTSYTSVFHSPPPAIGPPECASERPTAALASRSASVTDLSFSGRTERSIGGPMATPKQPGRAGEGADMLSGPSVHVSWDVLASRTYRPGRPPTIDAPTRGVPYPA